MKRILLISFLVVSALSVKIWSADLSFDSLKTNIIVFFTDEDVIGTSAVIKGIVSQTGIRETSTEKEKELGQSIQDRTKILVRLSTSEAIIPGNVLYVINDRNLIVAKLSVSSVFRSKSFGMMCVGYGNFRNVKPDYRVIQRSPDTISAEAYQYTSKGNYYRDTGDISKAIELYQKAISFDKNNPEAHMYLGYLYLDQKLLPFAIKEFDIAYSNIGKVYDREDRYLVLKGGAESRFMAVFNSELPKGHKLRERYLEEGIVFAQKAVAAFPESVESHYFLGRFYFDRSLEALNKIDYTYDEKAQDEMLKILSIDNNHFEANLILAKIYRKHDNKDKSEFHALQAVKIDPANTEARELLKSIKKLQ